MFLRGFDMDNTEKSSCPCEAVRKLEKIIDDHEKRLSGGDKNFAVIDQKLEHILEKLEKRDRFNLSVITTVVNGILTIILGYIAVKLGLQ